MKRVLTADGRTIEVECLSCAVTSGLVEPSGGTIAETEYFHAHQDIAYPIPGLVIVASKRHFYGLDEMTDEEASDYIQFLRRIRAAQREVLSIHHVYYFYNEDTTHHFHTWMVPRYDWMNTFGRSVESVRPVFLHARQRMATDYHLEGVRRAVASLREALRPSSNTSVRLVHLAPTNLETDAKEILGAALYRSTPEKINATLGSVYTAPETRLFGLAADERIVAVVGIRLNQMAKAEVLHIAVAESYRGRGYGRHLMELVEGMEGLTELYAETDRDAVGFYEHCGFSIESLGEKYPGVERFLIDRPGVLCGFRARRSKQEKCAD